MISASPEEHERNREIMERFEAVVKRVQAAHGTCLVCPIAKWDAQEYARNELQDAYSELLELRRDLVDALDAWPTDAEEEAELAERMEIERECHEEDVGIARARGELWM